MLTRFEIKHGLYLQSAKKLLTPNTFYPTDKEAELKELREVFCKDGAAVEVKPEKKEKVTAPKPEVDPTDDITLVKGVGEGTSKKLAEKGITTKSGLEAAMKDAARAEEMKEVLGANYQKILDQFVPPQA